MNAPASLTVATARRADLAADGDRRLIAEFLAGRADASLFHRLQWLDAVAAGCGHPIYYLLAVAAGGRLTGVLPLVHLRSRLFGSALVSSGFGVGGGILAADAAASGVLAHCAWNLAEHLGCSQVELRGGASPDGFTTVEGIYAGFARNLPVDEEAILKAIPRKQRAEVRRSQTFDLTVSVGRSPEDRKAHYRVYSESVRNLGTPVFPRTLFNAMLDSFGDDADILTIRKDGRPVSSVLSFYDRDTVYPYWGGGTKEARSLRANELLYFELMRHAAARGCTRFDFGRSKVGTGAFAYKKNWGFEPETLTYAIRTRPGAKPRSVNPLDPKYRLKIALWQRLPLWLANRLGPPIARGLG